MFSVVGFVFCDAPCVVHNRGWVTQLLARIQDFDIEEFPLSKGLLMVQRVQMILEDDIDGGEAAETVEFGLDGVTYAIDLSEAHAKELRDALAPWIGHARRESGRKTRSRKTAASSSSSANDIRAWAQQNGMNVSSRGRVPLEVINAYEEAMAAKK